MRAGFDFGISCTDLAVERDSSLAAVKYFPSDRELSEQRVRELLVQSGTELGELEALAVTGGHSARLPQQIDGVPVQRVNEVDALGAGAAFLLRDDWRDEPFLAVNSGSGTTCVLVNDGSCIHVGGNAIGGGTLVGLARLLLDTADALEIDELAEAGDAGAVDLRIRDAVSDRIGRLPQDATAVNFGRFIHANAGAGPENLAAGLANLVGQAVALTALTSAFAAGTARICILGRTPRLGSVRRAMERVFDLPLGSIEVDFPNQGPSASALGALAHGRTP